MRTEPTKVLSFDHLLQIIAAAELEINALCKRFLSAHKSLEEGRALLLDRPIVLRKTTGDFENMAVCLAAADQLYPTIIPIFEDMVVENPSLARAIREHYRYKKVCSQLYPTGRDLVPFALLIAIATVFNADTVLTLCWSDVNLKSEQAGIPAIEIFGAKGRANKSLHRMLSATAPVSASLSLERLFSILKVITKRIRSSAVDLHKDRVLLFVPVNRTICKGYGVPTSSSLRASADIVWMASLQKFAEDNNLPPFTLGQIRPTLLNMIQASDGSIEMARKIGNHQSVLTTWTHYTSDGVRKLYREKVGNIVLLNQRWFESGGKVDPRRLLPTHDKGAATPGFSCLNPFESPRPNQRHGSLCKDYGGCPSCPMAVAHPADPVCVKYYEALEIAICRSQMTLGARAWADRWLPVLSDLKALQLLVSEEVRMQAANLTAYLPNVG
jgi:hypothetical protein